MDKFTKVDRGWYANADGTKAVIQDGYSPSLLMDPRDLADGIRPNVEHSMGVGGEWAAVVDPAGRLREDHNAGENLDWFPTKREALEFLNR